MRRGFLLLPILLLSFSCASSPEKERASYTPPPPPQTPLDRKLSGMPSQELPITAPVDPEKLDKCTRYLLFTDQYVSAADYPDAEDTLKEAKNYCSPDDPRLNYMEAILADNNEEKEKAYRLYYKAALGYIKEGKMEQAFKCYSGMVSINPEGKEVKELKRYFEDEDY